MDEKKLTEIIEKLRSRQQEWKTVDAKGALILDEMGEKIEFIKDVVAMANNFEPSYLVIGVRDKVFSDVGALVKHHTKNDLNQWLAGKIDPPIIVDYQEFKIDSNEYALVGVFGNNPPYIIAQDLVHNSTDIKKRIDKGTILVRHEDRTEGISRSELEELLKKGLRKEFENETEKAKKIAFERSMHWEYFLTAELIDSGMRLIKSELNEIERGGVFRRSKKLTGQEFFDWSQLMLADLKSLSGQLIKVINEDFRVAWGRPGESGDPVMIKRTTDKIFSVCHNLLEWKLEFHFTISPDALVPLKQMLESWATHYFLGIESIPRKLMEPFEKPNPDGRYSIQIIFDPFPNQDEVEAEFEMLKKHPEKLIDI